MSFSYPEVFSSASMHKRLHDNLSLCTDLESRILFPHKAPKSIKGSDSMRFNFGDYFNDILMLCQSINNFDFPFLLCHVPNQEFLTFPPCIRLSLVPVIWNINKWSLGHIKYWFPTNFICSLPWFLCIGVKPVTDILACMSYDWIAFLIY